MSPAMEDCSSPRRKKPPDYQPLLFNFFFSQVVPAMFAPLSTTMIDFGSRSPVGSAQEYGEEFLYSLLAAFWLSISPAMLQSHIHGFMIPASCLATTPFFLCPGFFPGYLNALCSVRCPRRQFEPRYPSPVLGL